MLYFEVGQAVSLKYRRCLKTLQKSSLGILSENKYQYALMRKILGTRKHWFRYFFLRFSSSSFTDYRVVGLFQEHIIIYLLIKISLFKSLKICFQKGSCGIFLSKLSPHSKEQSNNSGNYTWGFQALQKTTKSCFHRCKFHRYVKILLSTHNLETNKPKFLFKFKDKTNIFQVEQ